MRDIAQVFRTHWEHARMKSILFLFLLIVSFRLGGITNRNTNTIRKILGRVVHSLSACVAGVFLLRQGMTVLSSAGQRRGVALPIALMIGAAKIYFIVFGILTIAGGVLGYVKAGSMASIIAGSISGVLLLLAAWLMPEHQAAGLILALVISLLLAAQFIPKFFRTFKVMPAGLMSLLSAFGIIVAIAAWLRK